MNLRQSLTLGLGACFAAMTFAAAAQSASQSSPPSASDKSAATSQSTSKRHATSAPRASASHEQMAAGSQDTAYHDALKQCVAGPADQRDRCIDNAIARFGRS